MTKQSEPLTVMLADDEPLAREYLEELLRAMPDIDVLDSFCMYRNFDGHGLHRPLGCLEPIGLS